MRIERIIIIIAGMIIMILFILMMIFWKRIFNFRKDFNLTKKISISINDLISILGSKSNIVIVNATLTRLRVTVYDIDEIDYELLKQKFKLRKINVILKTVVLPFGRDSMAIKSKIDSILKSS